MDEKVITYDKGETIPKSDAEETPFGWRKRQAPQAIAPASRPAIYDADERTLAEMEAKGNVIAKAAARNERNRRAKEKAAATGGTK